VLESKVDKHDANIDGDVAAHDANLNALTTLRVDSEAIEIGDMIESGVRRE